MASFVNACVFTAASAGTGSFVVSAALTGWMTPATAGAVNGATYRYRAYSNDLTQWEIGTGTYTSSTTTLTRTVTASSSGGATVDFTAPPVVALTSFAADISSGVEITGGTVTGLTNLTLASGAATPATNDAAALGTTSLMWSDLFLAAGAVINFDNGDTTITDGTNTLDFAGATSGYRFDSLITPLANDGAALGSATVSFSDLFLASGGVINFNNGDVTLTHSADALTFAGAASGYTFSDGGVVLGAATGGNKGAGTINATTVYKNNVPIGWTLLGTLTTTSGTTQPLTGIASGYRAWYIELEDVSFTAAATLNVAATTDNTNFGTTVNIATALTGSGNTVSGTVWIYGVSETSATGKSVVPITNMNNAATMFTTISRIQNSGGTTGVFTGLRFAGGTFDAGTIRVYGVA